MKMTAGELDRETEISTELSTIKSGRFKITRIKLRIPNLPAPFVHYRFVQLSDLHYGPATRPSIVETAIEITNSLKPSLVLLTGDYVVAGLTGLKHKLATDIHPKFFGWTDYRRKVRTLARELSPILSRLQPEDGIVGVFGNHDYLEGIGTIRRQLPQSIRWLKNQRHDIVKNGHQLTVFGVDDARMGDPCLERTFSGEKPGFAQILLSHNPDIVLDQKSNLIDTVDLMLCGHTHGGQIRFPMIGALRSCTKQKVHILGLSRHGRTHVYTNAGIGHVGVPLRLFCPPEITCFELVE